MNVQKSRAAAKRETGKKVLCTVSVKFKTLVYLNIRDVFVFLGYKLYYQNFQFTIKIIKNDFLNLTLLFLKCTR